MSSTALKNTIDAIAVKGKGILAADESTATITKRFNALNIVCDEDSRRAYRELLMTTPHFSEYVAGVILYEETLFQKTSSGQLFPELLQSLGVIPGIKVDKGLVPLQKTDGEQVTQGLDDLAKRLQTYKEKGARFAKWRCVYKITDQLPSQLAIESNAEVLARYASICQSEGIVPIVEPEILIDGAHTIERCEMVSLPVFQAVFNALIRHHVDLQTIILKPSMVISGNQSAKVASVSEVAVATLRVLKTTVPPMVPTINFLSGGQTPVQATQHLNLMNQETLPWNLSFSYARALQDDCMKIWKGQASNVAQAQAAFEKRARLNSLAAKGEYHLALET